jgi:hypothetical protein
MILPYIIEMDITINNFDFGSLKEQTVLNFFTTPGMCPSCLFLWSNYANQVPNKKLFVSSLMPYSKSREEGQQFLKDLSYPNLFRFGLQEKKRAGQRNTTTGI